MSKNLVRTGSKAVTLSNSVSGAAGKGMVLAGSAGMLVWLLAGLISFTGVVGVSVILVVAGLFFWE